MAQRSTLMPQPPDYGNGGAGPSTSYGAGSRPPFRAPSATTTAGVGSVGAGAVPTSLQPGGRPPWIGLDLVTLRFHDPHVEAAYLRHQTVRLLGVDRAAFFTTFALLFLSWLMRGGREPCHGILALTALSFLGHALALCVLQSGREHPPRRRIVYIVAVRLAYASAYASLNPLCRRDDVLGCSPRPERGLQLFVNDTGLVLLLYQTIAMPLPYRVHMAASGAALGLLILVHNAEVCAALCSSCHAAWFNAALHKHHRLAKALLLAVRPFVPRPITFGTVHACWCSLLFAQVVAGFLLPGCITYLMEEAARRRYLAGWQRRQQQQQNMGVFR